MYVVRRVRLTASLLTVSTLLAVSSRSMTLPVQQESHSDVAQLFAYDQSVAFDLKEESTREQNGVTIRDVNYAAHTSQRGRVKAFLVRPVGKGPFAGVLFFHWYGTPNGNRNQFLDEAVTLAQHGTVSLLIEGYFPWAVEPADAQTDRQRVIDETIEVRRALDLLLSQPQVDRKRIGFVGHDYGAMYGAIVAGVEKRAKAYVLIGGIGSFSNWSLDYWLVKKDAGFKEAYRKALNTVDPIAHISHAAPAALLFQFANSDEHITRVAAIAFSDAASKPKQVNWYDGRHQLDVESARNDRRVWLTRELRLARRTGSQVSKIDKSAQSRAPYRQLSAPAEQPDFPVLVQFARVGKIPVNYRSEER